MIDQIVHVKHIAACKDSRHAGLEGFIDHGSGGGGGDLNACPEAQLVFRNQAAGKEQCITVKFDLRSGNRISFFIHLGNGHAFQAFAAADIRDGVAEIERNIIVLEALNDVPVQAGGIRHELHTGKDFCPLKGHPPGHDQADIARTEDHNAFPRHQAFQVDEALRGPGGIDSGAAGAGRTKRATGTLAAAHGQDDRLGMNDLQAAGGGNAGHGMVRRDGKHGGGTLDLNTEFSCFIDIPLCVFRPCQFLLETVQAETVMDTLAQDTAGVLFPLENQQGINPVFLRGDRRGQAGRTGADDQDIHKPVIHDHDLLSGKHRPYRTEDCSFRRFWSLLSEECLFLRK